MGFCCVHRHFSIFAVRKIDRGLVACAARCTWGAGRALGVCAAGRRRRRGRRRGLVACAARWLHVGAGRALGVCTAGRWATSGAMLLGRTLDDDWAGRPANAVGRTAAAAAAR